VERGIGDGKSAFLNEANRRSLYKPNSPALMFKSDMKYVTGIDQYGRTYHNLGKHPRKELLGRLGYKKADKIYRDKKMVQ